MQGHFPLTNAEKLAASLAVMVIMLGAAGILIWKEGYPSAPHPSGHLTPSQTRTDPLSKRVDAVLAQNLTGDFLAGTITSVDSAHHSFEVVGNRKGVSGEYTVGTDTNSLIVARPAQATAPATLYNFANLTVSQFVTIYGPSPQPLHVTATLVMTDPPIQKVHGDIRKLFPPPSATPQASSGAVHP